MGDCNGLKEPYRCGHGSCCSRYLLAPPFSIAIDVITNALASFVAADNAKLSFVSPAMGQSGTFTKREPDALSAYNDAVNNFKSILGERREQINSNQRLPNLPDKHSTWHATRC